MNNLLSLTVILVGSIVLLGLLSLLFKKRGKSTSTPQLPNADGQRTADSECCGAHVICEKESLLSAVSKQIEYYDDDELDRFKGKTENSYSESEISEFREIFYTLQESDVAGWIRSLQLRGILLPDELKDEVILIIGERRYPAQ